MVTPGNRPSLPPTRKRDREDVGAARIAVMAVLVALAGYLALFIWGLIG